jgi:hypothetical protein
MTHDRQRQPLGELLVGRGLLTQEQLAAGLAESARTQRPLGAALVALGLATEQTIAMALATQNGGLVKSEYGFAVGFGPRIEAPRRVAAPPVSTPSADLERRLDAMARQLADAAVRVVNADLARDQALRERDEALEELELLRRRAFPLTG